MNGASMKYILAAIVDDNVFNVIVGLFHNRQNSSANQIFSVICWGYDGYKRFIFHYFCAPFLC